MIESENIIKKIKEKKELSGIDSSIVKQHLDSYLAKNKLSLGNLSPPQLKIVVRDIRENLRKNVGRFKASFKDRRKLLEKNDINGLLKTHSSTKERFDFYPKLKAIIKKLAPHSILDLGCGINPLALAEPGVRYYAADINLDDLEIVNLFFKKNKIEGNAFFCDLNNIGSCKIPKTDLTLVFKVFDILGEKDFETAMQVMEKINSKNIIVSFSTRTISGKRMNRPRRVWFEKLLNSILYKFEVLASDNEVFYI